MSENRAIDLSIEVPGTPEAVWHAIATGPGITSWFVPSTVDEHVGGEAVQDFGHWGKESSTVTAWEPGARFVCENETDGKVFAAEWLVEAKSGDTCVVRLVFSGFGDDDGDQLEAMTNGWRVFLENLRLHLTHFAGQVSRTGTPVGMAPGPNAKAWEALSAAIGVPADLRAGDRLSTPAVTGTVEVAWREPKTCVYVVLAEGDEPGTVLFGAEGEGDDVMVYVYAYHYGGSADAGAGWAPLLADRFPMPPLEAPPA